MKKLSFFMAASLLAFTLLMPSFASANDIKGHWAEDKIQILINKQIMEGDNNGNFLPNQNVSRAAFTKMLIEALGIETSYYESKFHDVKDSNSWYYKYVVTASEFGLVSGDDKGNFNPSDFISRQAIAVMINNALEYLDINTLESNVKFSDEKQIGAFAKEAVKKLNNLGIISGIKKDGKLYFEPTKNASRAAAAVMVVGLLDTIDNPFEIVRVETYNYSFKEMVDKQVASSSRPQTDYGGAWYDASRGMVEYYANPNNFKNSETGIYQFLVLSGSSGLSANDLNTKVLFDKGVLSSRGADFIRASKEYNINEIYLISHALLETGNGKSKLATGIEVGLNKDKKPVMVTDKNRSDLKDIKKTYNMFGIGAFDHCPESCGSERAYELGWFTVGDAIFGGAKFISNGYIGRGQDTLYKMRWNPISPGYPQYATDVGWAAKQTTRIKEMFKIADELNANPLVFEIPSFKNLPASSKEPQDAARFNVDKKLEGKKAIVKVDKDGTLNVRSGPNTRFDPPIAKLKTDEEVTIIGFNSGWYKINTGKVQGWVSADYLQLVDDVKKAGFGIQSFGVEGTFGANSYNYASIATEGTPLQSEPLFEYNVITELNAGLPVTIISETDEWYEVIVNNGGTSVQSGWIYKDYVSVSGGN